MVSAVDHVNEFPSGGNHPAVPAAQHASESAQRVAYLDGIRALAIGGVLAYHWLGSQLSLGGGGYVGVDLFFVLSGYIISTMLWRSRPRGRSVVAQYRTFLWRRVVRLYPALISLVLGTITIYALLPAARAQVADLIAPGLLALVQGSMFPMANGNGTPFSITWSLSIEWMFYLAWPLAILAARRAGIGASQAAKAATILAGAMYFGALFQTVNWFYFGPLARIPEMLIGGALALAVVDFSYHPPPRSPRIAMGIAFLLVAVTAEYVAFAPVVATPLYRFVGLPLAVGTCLNLIWLGLRTENGLIKWLSWKPLTLLGRASYSIYLWNLDWRRSFPPAQRP
jgi:peptidoglycan/LPS O-acetylase OafA/YrhL